MRNHHILVLTFSLLAQTAPCPIGCDACTSSTTCIKCASGYYLQATDCISCPSFGCDTCDAVEPGCTSCKSGFTPSASTEECVMEVQVCLLGHSLEYITGMCYHCQSTSGCSIDQDQTYKKRVYPFLQSISDNFALVNMTASEVDFANPTQHERNVLILGVALFRYIQDQVSVSFDLYKPDALYLLDKFVASPSAGYESYLEEIRDIFWRLSQMNLDSEYYNIREYVRTQSSYLGVQNTEENSPNYDRAMIGMLAALISMMAILMVGAALFLLKLSKTLLKFKNVGIGNLRVTNLERTNNNLASNAERASTLQDIYIIT